MASKQNLSDCCRAHGLPVTGNKDELLERLLGQDALMRVFLKSALECKRAKKQEKTSPVLKKTILKEKKSADFEKFCVQQRPCLIAGGMTSEAAIAKKLKEMYSVPKGKATVTSHVGQTPSADTASITKKRVHNMSGMTGIVHDEDSKRHTFAYDPASIPNSCILTMNEIPAHFRNESGLVEISRGIATNGQPAWLYLRTMSSSASLPDAAQPMR